MSSWLTAQRKDAVIGGWSTQITLNIVRASKPIGVVPCLLTVGVGMTNDDLRSFYDRDYGRLLGIVTLVTGSRAAAEDVVHEAVARAWERDASVTLTAGCSPWR